MERKVKEINSDPECNGCGLRMELGCKTPYFDCYFCNCLDVSYRSLYKIKLIDGSVFLFDELKNNLPKIKKCKICGKTPELLKCNINSWSSRGDYYIKCCNVEVKFSQYSDNDLLHKKWQMVNNNKGSVIDVVQITMASIRTIETWNNK